MLAALLALLLGADPRPGPWLALPPVDLRARRPFRADAVFERYLLRRDARPPVAGERVKGELGTEAAWAPYDPAVEAGWLHATVECEADGVFLADLQRAALLFVNGAAFVGDLYAYGFRGVPVALRKGRNDLFVAGLRGDPALVFRRPPAPLFDADWDVTKPDLVAGGRVEGRAARLRINASLEEREGLPPLSLLKRECPLDGLALEVRAPSAARRRTYESTVDGSIQEYAILEAAGGGPAATVLSLHGAGVDCLAQARAYSPKERFRIVAPTNRRPFGFDWQDWGRLDAYDAVADAGAGGERLFLTGHSMGGHGTWHLAANDPDRFLAIAPSAGWCSFDTYGGGPRPASPLSPIWFGADGPSRTLDLVRNLAGLPVYVLHGTADDNVPADEARRMIAALEAAGAKPAAHFEEGAGHWWDGDRAKGADCVDWPGIFEFFEKAPRGGEPETIDFVTMDPAVDADHYWLHVHEPLEPGKPVRVRGSRSHLDAENARLLRIPPGRCVVNGRALETTTGWIRFGDGGPSESPEPPGPPPRRGFKRAFENRFVLLYGTRGTPEENRELYERARYDAQAWWYRGNGRAELLPDREVGRTAGRNVVLYGNAETNAAWDAVFAEDLPLRAGAEGFRFRGEPVRADAAIVVAPRRGEPGSRAAAFVSVGVAGARLGYTLAPFTSGVGYPDYVLFSTEVLRSGDGGVAAAGFLDASGR